MAKLRLLNEEDKPFDVIVKPFKLFVNFEYCIRSQQTPGSTVD